MAGEKILIVDDEIDVLELCKRILETKGYQVKTASNGYEAINMAKFEVFDLLLTDNQMPGITGLEIAQALKQSDPNIICVTMTGFSTIDIVIEALKIDIDEFVMKPFTPNELSMAIAKALEKQRLRRENFRLRSLIPLFELNRSLLGTREVKGLLNQLLKISKEETQADLVWLYTNTDGQITPHYHEEQANNSTSTQNEACLKLAQQVFEANQQLFVIHKNADEQEVALLNQLQAQSMIATPLQSQTENLGALVLIREKNDFAPSDGEFLSVMCGQASIALENARLFTDKQKAYEELQKLDHMKSEFINIAAHELRTPLTILMGYTTIVEDLADETQAEFVGPIIRNAMRLRGLIDDMLNLKYLESGIPTMEREPLNLAEAVHAVIADMALSLKEKNITVEVDIPSDFPMMIADSKKLDLIMFNLVDNAIKFNKPDGKIFIQAMSDDTYATLSVKDTGIGIPKTNRDKIFERFVQLEPSLTREHGGIGLGLATVRGMVNVCGGEISVNSTEDEGSTFTFTLPLDNTHLEVQKLVI